jgi:DNA-binding response OmpR family regulator
MVFQQLDSGFTKQHGGTGLGLALTRRLAEQQGGSVGARSALGQGSVFHVVLPRVANTEAGDVQPVVATVIESPPPSLPPGAPRVLVIEDDLRDQRRIVAALAEAGLQAVTASTAAQARLRAAGEAFEAITLDLLLPDGSGLEVLATIRADGPNRDTPVVVLTLVTDRLAVAGFSVSNVLSKPIRGGEVIEAMRRLGLVRASRARVLVIDDETASLDLMASTLDAAGIDAVCRSHARSALDELDAVRPDAIILDLMMPEFDGFQVLEELRWMPAWQQTPVFIWTSMHLSEADYARLARSASVILGKGNASIEQLLGRLREFSPQRLRDI